MHHFEIESEYLNISPTLLCRDKNPVLSVSFAILSDFVLIAYFPPAT